MLKKAAKHVSAESAVFGLFCCYLKRNALNFGFKYEAWKPAFIFTLLPATLLCLAFKITIFFFLMNETFSIKSQSTCT